MTPQRLFIFRPTLSDGGADRVVVTLLRHLDRRVFSPALLLLRREGELLGEVPADVPIVALGAPRLAVAIPYLVAWLRRERPDVVLSTSSAGNGMFVVAETIARSGARIVLSERNALVRPIDSAARVAFELRFKRLTYARADLVTAVSDGVAADLKSRLGLDETQVRTVWNPVVTDDFAERAAAPVEHPWCTDAARAAHPLIVACGRLVDAKDYPTMLAALVRLRERVPGVRLLILGEGSERGRIEARARELGLAEAVQLVGFDPNPQKYMARAALLWQSSTAEGLPGTIIQALAVGTPAVATDCDFGPREVIEPDRNGYLVPVGDAAALAEQAAKILGDPALRARLAAGARATGPRYSMASGLAHYTAALLGQPAPTA